MTVDQWAGSLLGIAGHPVVETPTLDQLARAGTRYTRAYAECPICIPARRSMMTGTSSCRHGDRDGQPESAQCRAICRRWRICFRDGGYQVSAIGKLHVYPSRDRIDFDDALIAEEVDAAISRQVDDYELFLADQGYPGQQFMHGMSNNEYSWRFWHLGEHLHVTNWITFAAARAASGGADPTLARLLARFLHPPAPSTGAARQPF